MKLFKSATVKFRNIRMSVIALVLMFAITTFCPAQAVVDTALHDFYDRKGNIITVGTVIGLNANEITVRDGLGKKHLIETKTLSSQGQRFLKGLKNQTNLIEKNRKRADDLASKLDASSSHLRIKALKAIQTLGQSARGIAPDLFEIGRTDSNPDVRLTAILCFLSIGDANKATYSAAIKLLMNDKESLQLISENPNSFLESLVRFNEISESLIINAAFDGELLLDSQKILPTKKPVIFGQSSAAKINLRQRSAFYLAQLKTSLSRQFTLDLIGAAEQRVNGGSDLKTVENIIFGWTISRNASSRILLHAEIAKKYRKLLPRAVNSWDSVSSDITKQAQRQDWLRRAAVMRNFYDRNGNLIARGNFENFDNGTLVIANLHGEYSSIDVSRLSSTDQNWLDAKLSKEK